MATVADQKQRAVVISFSSDRDIIDVDACLDETHTFTNTVTDHPVEEGFNVTDHSRPDPDQVTLRCFVSNTPITAAQQTRTVKTKSGIQFETTSTSGSKLGADKGRGHEAYVKLKKFRDDGTLVKVVTTLRTYESDATTGMAITSLGVSRTSKNFDGLEFTITLKQVRIIKNKQTSDVTRKDKRTGQKKKEGNKVDKDATDSQNSALFDQATNMSKSNNKTISGIGNFALRQ